MKKLSRRNSRRLSGSTQEGSQGGFQVGGSQGETSGGFQVALKKDLRRLSGR